MKNIFKKNQIIITALAIMIVIAGYLSFTNRDKADDLNSIQTTNPGDDLSSNDGMVLVQDTIGDTTGDTTGDTQTDDTDMNTTADDENDETTPVDTEDDTDELGELGDISDQDLLQVANDVKDTGELKLDENVPGEAVLASTTLEAGYFIKNKMQREQLRSIIKADCKEIMENPNVDKSLREEAVQRLIEITEIAEDERNAEILLGARGFDNALVTINDGKVNVVIDAESISDQQLAIIEDVVKQTTGIGVDKMTIVPVIMED